MPSKMLASCVMHSVDSAPIDSAHFYKSECCSEENEVLVSEMEDFAPDCSEDEAVRLFILAEIEHALQIHY